MHWIISDYFLFKFVTIHTTFSSVQILIQTLRAHTQLQKTFKGIVATTCTHAHVMINEYHLKDLSLKNKRFSQYKISLLHVHYLSFI